MNLPSIAIGLAALAGTAPAQCFNLDFGDGFGSPSSAHGGAVSQAGHWQTINPTNGAVVGLTDVTGSVPGATAEFRWAPTGTSGVSAVDQAPAGDDEALLDDWWWHNSQDESTLFQVRFRDLEPGLYRVVSYAWWGNTGFKRTGVQVQRGGHQLIDCGMGDWTGQHVLSVLPADGTFVTDAAVSFDGQLLVDFHSISFPSAVNGLQLVKLDACPSPAYTPYCDQGTVEGCDPVVLASGQASASNPGPFDVELVAAARPREGLFYFSTTGTTSVPWQGGPTLQCVRPPVQRTPVQSSGNAFLPCTGYYWLDFNDWMAAHPLQAPPAGAVVRMQVVAYGVGNPASAALLDALWFTVAP